MQDYCPNDCGCLDKLLSVCFERPLLSENGKGFTTNIPVVAQLKRDNDKYIRQDKCHYEGFYMNDKTHRNGLTYDQWKLKLIQLIVDETIDLGSFLKLEEIKCVLSDDCDYPKAFLDGETPEDIWQGEIDAIGDSQ